MERENWCAKTAIIGIRAFCSFLAGISVHAKLAKLFSIFAPFVEQGRRRALRPSFPRENFSIVKGKEHRKRKGKKSEKKKEMVGRGRVGEATEPISIPAHFCLVLGIFYLFVYNRFPYWGLCSSDLFVLSTPPNQIK